MHTLLKYIAFLLSSALLIGALTTQVSAQSIEVLRIQSADALALSVTASAQETGLTLQITSDIFTCGLQNPARVKSNLVAHSIPLIAATFGPAPTADPTVVAPVPVVTHEPVQKIAFNADNTHVTAPTRALLARMAQTMDAHPEIAKVEVESRSPQQAQIVVAQMITLGVDADRISSNISRDTDTTKVRIVAVR